MTTARIGRNVFRLTHHRDDLDIVAISDIADPEALTYLLKYDSLYGRFPAEVSYSDRKLSYNDRTVAFTNARAPGDADWAALGVDVVLDTTSRYRSRDALERHLEAGAKKVILTSSPETPGEIPLLLRGINDDILGPETDIVALGSNTSNAAAPILEILHGAFGLERAFLTTVKAMSNAGVWRTCPPTRTEPAGQPGRTSSPPRQPRPRSSPKCSRSSGAGSPLRLSTSLSLTGRPLTWSPRRPGRPRPRRSTRRWQKR